MSSYVLPLLGVLSWVVGVVCLILLTSRRLRSRSSPVPNKWPGPCPYCGDELLYSEDRGLHCDGCDKLLAEDIDSIIARVLIPPPHPGPSLVELFPSLELLEDFTKWVKAEKSLAERCLKCSLPPNEFRMWDNRRRVCELLLSQLPPSK